MKKILFFIFLFVFAKLLSAQDSTLVLTLEQAKTLALQNNKTILNARLDIVSAKKKVWETTAIGLPQVSASASHNYNIDLPTTLIPAQIFNPQAPAGTYMELKFGTDNNTNINLQATQLIFSGEYLVGLQASKIFKQLSELKEQKSEDEVKSMVEQSYYLVLIAKETKSILDSNLIFTNNLFEQTKALHDEGFLDETDVDQIQLNLSNLKNAVISETRQIQIAENVLKFQLGVDLSAKIVLTDDLKTLLSNENFDAIISQSLNVDNQIDYNLLLTQEHLQKLNVKREKSAFLPNIAAFYNHQESMMGDKIQWFDNDGKWYRTNIVGISINVPIFSSGQRLMKVAEANIELDKIQNQRWMLQQNLMMQQLQIKSELKSALDSYKTNTDNKLLSEKIYHRTKTKFQKGMSSSMEMTQSQLQYFNSIQAYYQSVLNVLNAESKLNKLLNN